MTNKDMGFQLTILGSSSATPAHGRHPSSQVLRCNNDYFLIDCGEGTQMQLHRYGIKRTLINHIFISHLHGDHFYGLIGLISSFNLLKRSSPLHIYAAADLEKMIQVQLELTDCKLVFELHFHTILMEHAIIFESKELQIETIPLSHRIACLGFVVREKLGERKINKTQTDRYQIPVTALAAIKKGEDYTNTKGTVIANSLLTTDPNPVKSFAYISDTLFLPEIVPHIQGVDLLYHEATFGNDRIQRAFETFHSTAEQAATIAKNASVKQLIIGHFSAKYSSDDLPILLAEAKAVFENTNLAEEGLLIEI